MSDDASDAYRARESLTPPATFSLLSGNESADSVPAGLGASFCAQQDNFSDCDRFDVHDLPHSPLPDSAHPWDEAQQQSYDSPLAETTAGSQDGGESASTVASGLGSDFSAWHDYLSDYDNPDDASFHHSPISTFVSSSNEIQQQSNDSISAKTTAISHGDSVPRRCCGTCNAGFADNYNLKRHIETTHKTGRSHWVCTVKGCSKYNKPVFREDNFKRHCKTMHPTVNLEQFGL